MQTPKVHIVSFDVPYPADYGGVIDVYYKVKALSEAGAEVYLHCFQYGREQSEELARLCKQVWYYPRITGIRGISLHLPYIVYSRRSAKLLENLSGIEAPILFEGIHTTHHLNHPAIKHRYKAIRAHNVEHDYYAQLAVKENNVLKKQYYQTEATFLKRYEYRLKNAQGIFSLSATDDEYFSSLYPHIDHAFIAPFHPYDKVVSQPGRGQYCLYHGNLSHPENIEAAMFLLRDVIPLTDTPFIIAGRNPAKEITKACDRLTNCSLVTNPDATEMSRLVSEAHINILPTFQPTGMKLKLLYALFSGRHLLVNPAMLRGTGLEACCTIANNAAEMNNEIRRLTDSPFTTGDIAARASTLNEQYNNRENAKRLLRYLQR